MTKEVQTGMIEEDRYRRQKLIWGDEGQAKLDNAKVAVIGLGPQGIYSALCMAALGIGNIVLVDGNNSDVGEMFLDMDVPQGARGDVYPELLRRINAQIGIQGYATNLESSIDQLALSGANVIVDATNNQRSKRLALAFGREKDIPVLSTSSRWGYTKLMLGSEGKEPEMLMPMFEGHEQDPLMALVMAGIVTEKVKKLAFGSLDEVIRDPIRYRLGGKRFGFPDVDEEIPLPNYDLYRALNILFLGEGALGNWATIAMSHLRPGRVDKVDYDIFESHNINRQVLAYDGIDAEKAAHLAEKLRRMTKGATESEGFNVKILPGFSLEREYDYVFDLVDNFYTRAVNSAFAVNNHIPLVSAGAGAHGGRWDVHVEGETQCMGCMFDIYERGREEEIIRRVSCAANPNPAVVMSNAVAGVAAVLELFSLVEPEKYGGAFNGEQTYRAVGKVRLGTSPSRGACDC